MAKAGSGGKSATKKEKAVPPPAPRIAFEDLYRQVQALRAAGDKAGLYTLSQNTRPESVTSPHVNVEIFLARLMVEGFVTQPPEYGRVWLMGDQGQVIGPVLERIEQLDPEFHLSHEFDLWMQLHRHGPKDALRTFPWLVKAARAMPDRRDVLERLRGAVFTLLDQDQWDEDEQVERDKIEALGDIQQILSDLLEAAVEGAHLEEDRLMLKVFQVDLAFRTAEPWDYPAAARMARQLPCSEDGQIAPELTPAGWAFLWELRQMSAAGLPRLLEEYGPGRLRTRIALGLYRVAEALVADGDERMLLEGLTLLSAARSRGDSMEIGGSILLQTPDGENEVPIGWTNLEVATPGEILLHLAEGLPQEHCFVDRLLAAGVVWRAGEDFDQVDEGTMSVLSEEAVNWLRVNVPGFDVHLMETHPSATARLQMLLASLVDRLQRKDTEEFHLSLDIEEVKPTATERQAIRRILSSLAGWAGAMPGPVEKQWRRVAEPALRIAVVGGEKNEQVETLEIAREFVEDLRASRGISVLAWLEHVAGTAEDAARLYEELLEDEKIDPKWAAGNLASLVNSVSRSEDAEVLSKIFEAMRLPAGREKIGRDLAAAARAKLRTFQEQDQFERTAVARWPSLSQPARKLLTVLATVDRYDGFEELARYANMEVKWVEIHYNKLIEAGMVFRKDGKFRINQYIRPLIERENQHQIVGRIIRTGTTSAVKQVFNSNTEFSIYQIMVQLCPNHLVFPNCALQTFMQFERMKELVGQDDFSYYLRASVDILVVSSTTFLPMLAIEVDSAWHDTDHQQLRDERKDRLFAAAGVPFLRLRRLGSPSESVIRGEVADHLQELVRTLRTDLPGYAQARELIVALAAAAGAQVSRNVPLPPVAGE